MKYLAWLLSFSIGFLSMAQEILWIRIVGFAFQGAPQVFALVLTVFLAGISLGALLGKMLCSRTQNVLQATTSLLGVAGLLDLSLVISIPVLYEYLSIVGLSLLILISAMLKGTIFPIAHHLGSSLGPHLGRSISWVYFMNIMGSTLGPLVVGLFLLDQVSITAALHLLAYITLTLAICLLLWRAIQEKRLVMSCLASMGLMAVLLMASAFDRHDHRLVKELMSGDKTALKTVIENRHGIIYTVQGKSDNDDIVYGGNVYDGRTNIDLTDNSNRIDRAYLLHVLHPEPRRVLVIGLSSGAWTQVLLSNPAVKTLDAVEINPGYLSLIRGYPHLASLLEDHRFNLFIDDGRRWLRRHPDKHYDLIVMNTTFHWRANVTNLLSQEMLNLLHQHLNEKGIVAFNATDSDDAFFTATQVFPQAYRYRNFIYAADYDFRHAATQDIAQDRLLHLRRGQQALFDFNRRQDIEAVQALVSTPFVMLAQVQAGKSRPLEMITDQNMIGEFKYGRGL